MNDFDRGMAESFGPELETMGERIGIGDKTLKADGQPIRAVVDLVENVQGISGALITTDTMFDVYIDSAVADAAGLDHRVRVILLEQGGFEGRVISLVRIPGGQYRCRISSKVDQ